MRAITGVAAGVTTLALLGCSGGPSVETDFDPSKVAAMQDWTTYSWMPEPDDRPSQVNSLIANRITASVDEQLASKGFAKGAGRTDFKVGWHLTTQAMTDYRSVNNSYGYGYGRWGYGGFGTTTSTTTQVNWTQGTLVIDIVDGQSNDLAWRGLAQGEIDPSLQAVERTEAVDDVVAKMLGRFPPSS